MDFFKSVGGKIVSGLVALAVVASAISWWRMDDAQREALVGGAGKIVGWLGVVLAVPWASFFLIGRVARLGSNAAGAALGLAPGGGAAGALAGEPGGRRRPGAGADGGRGGGAGVDV